MLSSIRSGRSLASSVNGKKSEEFFDAEESGEPTATPASGSGAGSGVFTNGAEHVKVAFLCEQVSHHPPISSAYYICPDKGIEACAVDQIAAKVSGMSVRIGPGELNKVRTRAWRSIDKSNRADRRLDTFLQGVFVKLNRDGPGKGEEYQVSNPQANVNGLLKGT